MKVRIAKKATKGQTKRWKRGMSSSSNPEFRKYRSQVNSLTSPLTNNNPSQSRAAQRLTEEALLQHNALGSGLKNLTLSTDDWGTDAGQLNQDDGIDSKVQRDRAPSIASSDANFEVESLRTIGLSDIDGKSTKSAATFASIWSNCTNASFGKLLNNWRANSLMHKEMLAVLAAVTETIKETGGKETETEYFAVLMTTLEGVDSDETLAATISLLSMVMRRLPAEVLKAKFAETSRILVELLAKFGTTEHVGLLRSLINCLCVLLRAQEQAVWQLTSTHQVYKALLIFLGHRKPMIRRAANRAILSIIKGSPWLTSANANSDDKSGTQVFHPMAAVTAEFCIHEIEQTRIEDDFKHTLIMVNVTKGLFSALPSSSVKAVAEMLLRLMTLGNVLVVSCSLQAFYHLFVTRPDPKTLSKELNANIISALYGYQPSLADYQPLCAWLTVMREAFGNFYHLAPQSCIENLPKIIQTVVACYESDGHQVHAKCNEVLKFLLLNCIRPSIDESSHQDTFKSIYATIESLLSYRYSHAWNSSFLIFPCLVRVFGKNHPSLVIKTVRDLSEMRETPNFNLQPDLDKIIGAAVRTLGPQAVIAAIPLQLGQGSNDLSKSWLIPVLRDYIRGATLGFYIRYFMAIVNQLQARHEIAVNRGQQAETKLCEILIDQLWSLLPSFSRRPTDIVTSFKTIARTLGSVLSSRPSLRGHVLTTLRTLIKECDSEEARNELARFAKNFLPILFNLYTNTEEEFSKEQRAAIYLTIETYLEITDKSLIKTMLTNVIEKFNNAEKKDRLLRAYLLDLMRAFVPHLDDQETLDKLFSETVEPLLKMAKKLGPKMQTEEKKGWRIIEAICKSTSPICRKFMEERFNQLLTKAKSSFAGCPQPAKLAVLRTIAVIIEHRPEDKLRTEEKIKAFVASFLPSLISSLLAASSRLKSAVMSMMSVLVNLFQTSSGAAGEEVAKLLIELAGAESSTPDEVALIISTLSHLILQQGTQFTPQGRDALARYILAKALDTHRPVVQAVIDGVKTLLKCLPKEKYLPYVEPTVKALTSMKEDLNKHFRFQIKELLVKLVRRYGAELIGKLAPESHRKMLRNIRKVETRKVKIKESKKEGKSKGEQSEEGESMWGDDNQTFKTFSSKSTKRPTEGIEDILADSSEDELLEEEDDGRRDAYPRGRIKEPEAWIEEDVENDEILDLSDYRTASRKILSANPFKKKVSELKESKKSSFPMTEDGKIVIQEDEEDEERRKKSRKRGAEDSDDDDGSSDANAPFDDETVFSALSKFTGTSMGSKATSFKTAMSYRTGGRGIHRDTASTQEPGVEYKSQRARGDMKRKGKPDPYAYIPLDRRSLNKRKAKKMTGQFNSVVRSAKRGADRGSKQKKRSGKNFTKKIKVA